MSSDYLKTSNPSNASDWRWPLWPLVPLYPYGQRRTLRQEVVQDTIWTFDQIQGILYVVTPIRMTVVRLKAGGLLVYAPVAPTPECIRLMNELVAKQGAVHYIILPTSSGLEHKVFVGPFARHFPEAQVYIAPDQWSFPVNLPLSWLGFPLTRTHCLPLDAAEAPFADDFDYAILGSIRLGIGAFEEVAFFHRRSQTLLLTDTLVAIPEDPPAIAQLDPYPLLFHARDHSWDDITDTPEMRLKGWQRIALFVFYFRPSVLSIIPFWRSLQEAAKSPLRHAKAYWGWFPFQWRTDWLRSFEALRGNGRLFVAPILQTLILNRAPQETLSWMNRVSQWNFQQIIPCHMQSPIEARPTEFRQAFAFLDPLSSQILPPEDFELLNEIETALHRGKIIPARQIRP